MTTHVLQASASMPDERTGKPVRIATLAAGTALALGAVGDQLLRGDPPGLGFGLWIAAIVVALELLSRVRGVHWTLAERLLALPILFFAETIAWRDAGDLAALDVAAALLAAAVLSASLYHDGEWDLTSAGLRDYVRACVAAGLGAAFGALPLLGRVAEERSAAPRTAGGRRIGALGRALALAVPLLLAFGGLLMSADPVFNVLVTNVFSFDIEELFWHVVVALALAWPIAGYLRGTLIARHAAVLEDRPLSISFGVVETSAVLGALDALFAVFVAVQLRFLFGGEALVRATAGMTYAEYARGGFFQLLWVCVLALPVILISHELLRAGDTRAQRAWRVLSGLMIALLGVIMLSAMNRMRLYVAAYGLTSDRLYASAFMLWLAVTFAWLWATVLRGRGRRFGIGALASGWGILGALNVANPDVLIARVNLGRVHAGVPVDASYLSSLGADAVPTLLSALPSLPVEQRCRIAQSLATDWGEARRDEDWRSWNRARATAEREVRARGASFVTSACALTSSERVAATTAATRAPLQWWEAGGAPSDAPGLSSADHASIGQIVAGMLDAFSYPAGGEPRWEALRPYMAADSRILTDAGLDMDAWARMMGRGTGARVAANPASRGVRRVERERRVTVEAGRVRVVSRFESLDPETDASLGTGELALDLERNRMGALKAVTLAWSRSASKIDAVDVRP